MLKSLYNKCDLTWLHTASLQSPTAFLSLIFLTWASLSLHHKYDRAVSTTLVTLVYSDTRHSVTYVSDEHRTDRAEARSASRCCSLNKPSPTDWLEQNVFVVFKFLLLWIFKIKDLKLKKINVLDFCLILRPTTTWEMKTDLVIIMLSIIANQDLNQLSFWTRTSRLRYLLCPNTAK